MYAAAYWGLLAVLLLSVFAALAACFQAFSENEAYKAWIERGQHVCTGILFLSTLILTYAFVSRDFSVKYVAEYSDSVLPMFYTVTALWAGQEGSLLFWAVSVAVMGSIFPFTRAYKALDGSTRSFYWAFFLVTQAFFLLLLTNWSSPFVLFSPPPADGRGLNPLLQNPGMIFHPPLLFLGYAGFTVPACLALASFLTNKGGAWLEPGRNWSVMSWILLSAGIILGAWWSYMELGWGGYWAWDPVENASLIPWLSATAFLHTAVVERRRKSLVRANVFLVSLTLLLCFFGTYLVRSGVIDSLHAFGSGGVGSPLMIFMLAGLAMTLLVLVLGRASAQRQLDGLVSRPGLLVIAAWMFLALGLIVFLGTMWPVISSLWSPAPQGFDAKFYNRVCLPVFVLMAVVLVFCPWLGWKGGLRKGAASIAAMGVFPVCGLALYWGGMHQPLAVIGAAASVAVIVGLGFLLAVDRQLRATRSGWGFMGVHLGVALMVLGVAFSGPYQMERQVVLQPNATVQLKGYDFRFGDVRIFETKAMTVAEGTLRVTKSGESVGTLKPQRRIYRNFDQPFAEVAVIPSFGDELYATLLGVDHDGSASLKISVHPLVNWIWIGGTILCLAGFLCLRTRRRSGSYEDHGRA